MASFDLHYHIIPSHPEAHLFTVTLTIEKPNPAGQTLSLPNWIPGSYMIRDFAKNIVSLAAQSNGKPLAVTQQDKSTWLCAPTTASVIITYDIYAWDLSVRSAHLDQTHAYFNGTSVFLAVEGQTDTPCKVSIVAPQGEAYDTWRVATSMQELGAQRYGFGTYTCADYDELIDHPVEIADFTLAHFTACGVEHDVVLVGKHYADMKRLCSDLTKICETHIQFFGTPAPMSRYVFMTLVVGEGYGGLEHRNSTSLICNRADLPNKHDGDTVTDGYRTYLGLCSHEYFHTWNVKRIKPAVYLPYELKDETYTELLWAFEGITSYYDDLGVLRSGIIDQKSYLALLGQTISRVLAHKGQNKQTVANSSFTTWTKFYKQDESASNNIVSYYTKGSLIALCIDLAIRAQSQHQFSLDDVMRHLWENFGKQGIGIQNNTIQQAIHSITQVDLTDFFNEALYTTNPLPIQALLAEHGITLNVRQPNDTQDSGGKAATKTPNLYVGMKTKAAAAGVHVTVVLDDSPAQQSGISAGDVIVAIDGLKAEQSNWQTLINYKGLHPTSIHLFRRDELLTLTLTPVIAPKMSYYLKIIDANKANAWLTPQR